MRDPYAWIDPFTELEEAVRHANQQYRAGQDAAWKTISESFNAEIRNRLSRAFDYIAERAAAERLLPFALKNRELYLNFEARMRAEAELLRYVVRPMLVRLERDGTIELRTRADLPDTVVVHYATAEPVKIALELEWRPR